MCRFFFTAIDGSRLRRSEDGRDEDGRDPDLRHKSQGQENKPKAKGLYIEPSINSATNAKSVGAFKHTSANSKFNLQSGKESKSKAEVYQPSSSLGVGARLLRKHVPNVPASSNNGVFLKAPHQTPMHPTRTGQVNRYKTWKKNVHYNYKVHRRTYYKTTYRQHAKQVKRLNRYKTVA